jgi:hypothetical protein
MLMALFKIPMISLYRISQSDSFLSSNHLNENKTWLTGTVQYSISNQFRHQSPNTDPSTWVATTQHLYAGATYERPAPPSLVLHYF